MKKTAAGAWVKVISVIAYVGAILSIIAGIAMIAGSSFLAPYIPVIEQGALSSAVIILVGIIAIAFGVFDLFVARGLWTYKNWARIAEIVIAILGFVSGIIYIIGSPGWAIFNIVVNGGIFYLIAINKDVRKLFK